MYADQRELEHDRAHLKSTFIIRVHPRPSVVPLALVILLATVPAAAVDAPPAVNLLLNPTLDFYSFIDSRTGKAEAWHAGSVACWNQDAYGDVDACRAPRVSLFRPAMPVANVVAIQPGKRFYQFGLLCELGLDHGQRVSFAVRGFQKAPGGLRAAIHLIRLDSQSGDWQPEGDKRVFPKHSRGELVRGRSFTATSPAAADFELTIENALIEGAFTESPDSSTDQPNTIGLEIELVNTSPDQPVWIYAPCLCQGPQALSGLPEGRRRPDFYRGIPRTIQKLIRGEPLHLIVMGSSIDRGSANPPMFLYDEDPQSPDFKKPLSKREFDGSLLGRPELNDYTGWWQHYFMYGGRLRRLLMEKFDYPLDKLLLNTMACDGSSISEAHSGLAEYATLALPPDPQLNGHGAGKTWLELYPAVLARPAGPRPDLVIFGSGANEKVDGADEVALFEGAIRWFQRHAPDVEFIICMWQNREGYTPNTGHMAELALRYQIPLIDFGRVAHLTTRHCNSYALCPRDGHPQAAGHFLWAKQLERAFDVAGPIEPGLAQRTLPERLHPASVTWEGEVHTYAAPHPRLYRQQLCLLDENVVNLWASGPKEELVGIRIDGGDQPGSRRKPMTRRDLRNSTFALGNLALGDRHIVEVTGAETKFVAVDCKTPINRRWIGVESSSWQRGDLRPAEFTSAVGGPCGGRQLVLPPDKTVAIDVLGTDLSLAYADTPAGGTLVVEVAGRPPLEIATDAPFETAAGEKLYLENRRGIRGLPWGVHALRVKARGGPATLLGVFAYDTRSNRDHERIIRGLAAPGDVVRFTAAFAARPLVLCSGRLACHAASAEAVTFGGDGPGEYQIVGQ